MAGSLTDRRGPHGHPRSISPGVLSLCLLALILLVLPLAMAFTTTFRTSVLLAVGAVALGTVLAITFAWLSARTTSPLRWILTPTMALLLAVPPISYALSWTMLGPPGFNLASWPGLVLVVALKIASLSYLLIVGPFRTTDASLVDAARVAGASRLRALLAIELPALAAALFGPREHVTEARRPHQRERIRLGAWGWLSGSAIALFALIALGLPLGRLVIGSLQPYLGSNELTLDNYTTVLANPQIRSAFGSTIVVGLVAAVFSLILAATPIAGGSTAGAVARVGRELAESARASGASAARALFGIRVRLLLRGFVAGWLIAAGVALGNVDVPILLFSPGSRTVSVVVSELLQSGSLTAASTVSCLLLGLITAVLAAGGVLGWLWTRRRRPAPVSASRELRPSGEVARV